MVFTDKFTIKQQWEEHQQYITEEYGFRTLSITDFIKQSKNLFLNKGYKRILDLGCGGGRHTIYFRQNGFNVYAADLDCANLITHLKRLNITGINICEHSFTSIPYADDFFDAVVCTSTIHHAPVSDITKGIDEIYRVLKPNGCFVFDMVSNEDHSYGFGTEIEEDTFIGSREGEDNIPHHYTNLMELQSLLNSFSAVEISKSIYSFIDLSGNTYSSKDFDIVAIK